jgi:hypothetical protein
MAKCGEFDRNTLIRFGSHRARDYAMRELKHQGLPRPNGCYSMYRSFGAGGCYKVGPRQLEALRSPKLYTVKFSVVRNTENIHECWLTDANDTRESV